MKEHKITFGSILTVAGTYIAFAIGSGFATGQEVMQYFTAYGVGAFGALIVYFIVGSAMDTEFITTGYREQFKAKDGIYKCYCGKYLGIF